MNTQQLVRQHVNELDKLADERGFDPVYQEVVRCLHEKLDRRNISPVEFLAGDFSLDPHEIIHRDDHESEVESARELSRENALDDVSRKTRDALDEVDSAVRRVRSAING